jgi:hypothetical protein
VHTSCRLLSTGRSHLFEMSVNGCGLILARNPNGSHRVFRGMARAQGPRRERANTITITVLHMRVCSQSITGSLPRNAGIP